MRNNTKDTDASGDLQNLESAQAISSVIGALDYPRAGMLVRLARLMLLIEHYRFWARVHFQMNGLTAVWGRVHRRLRLLFLASGNGKLDRALTNASRATEFQRNNTEMKGSSPRSSSRQELLWSLDELIYFRGRLHARGWAFSPGRTITAVSCKLPSGRCCDAGGYGIESRDIELEYGQEARNCRFAFAIDVPDNEMAGGITILFRSADGTRFEIKDPGRAIGADPLHRAAAKFWETVQAMTSGSVLEIGSRNRTGQVHRGLVPSSLQYTGFDIVAGKNVDVIGDAHFLSRYFPLKSFDVAFAYSVFEHLLMPWKVVVELNQVMKPGGMIMLTTHQAWPLHEEPWDFWRFSSHAWRGLFNRYTGFEILESVMGEQASIVPHILHSGVVGLDRDRCCLGSLVVARKTGDSNLLWDVDPGLLLDQPYPS